MGRSAAVVYGVWKQVDKCVTTLVTLYEDENEAADYVRVRNADCPTNEEWWMDEHALHKTKRDR